MRDEGGVVGVADYYSGDAFGAAVGVECVGWKEGRLVGGMVEGSGGFVWIELSSEEA